MNCGRSKQYFSSSETFPPNLWDFYPTRSHEFGSCLVTSSSAMEALALFCGPRWAGAMLSKYRKLVYGGDRYNDNTLSFTYLKSNLLHASGFFIKIFDRFCHITVFFFFFFFFFFLFFFFFFLCESTRYEKQKKNIIIIKIKITTVIYKPVERTHYCVESFFFFFFFFFFSDYHVKRA